ncbi:Gypsy retrotransposon integrase-like protein 1 [Gossypium australe]|uniref:Gypsy retrotransposon integrase-like protein 1 n=1 Tax=Gossypium australe TaxID=47621 RepID=A0A5B6WEA6_9ROSI|nr:Gypsy retrotransposon integrase-like protein 1 [Gossypium australe]
MDYFTNWIEAKALTTITGKQMEFFSKIQSCVGSVHHLWLKALLKHPQTNRQEESGEAKGAWLKELPEILWAL